jgi:hypothetical protein
MSDQSKGRHDVYVWVEGLFHPRLKPTELPTIDDGVDAKVICFCAGFVACLVLCMVVKHIEAIKQFFNF